MENTNHKYKDELLRYYFSSLFSREEIALCTVTPTICQSSFFVNLSIALTALLAGKHFIFRGSAFPRQPFPEEDCEQHAKDLS
jgi:hypothetical protein